ncbi:MAG: aminoglycoside phosphotransferase [Bryobacterales bacterium]|nr:aminoglycoside phosphotransferase [Bryobacterales bacterium]
MTLHELARYFPEGSFGGVRDAVALSMGQSGALVYSVETEKGTYILRIHGGNHGSWQQVSAMHALASGHGIAPLVVHTDAAAQAIVTEKVVDRSFVAAIGRGETRAAAFGSLVELLIRLHALPVDGAKVGRQVEFAESVWESQVGRPGFPAWAIPLGRKIVDAAEIFAKDARLVLSHGDLHPANILWDGTRAWLVDWERAGGAHPYLDVATVSNFLSLPAEAGLRLLEMQEKAPVVGENRTVFATLRDYASVVYGAVFLSLVEDLDAVELSSREQTPTLPECFRMLSTRELALSDGRARALIAAAFFKQCG